MRKQASVCRRQIDAALARGHRGADGDHSAYSGGESAGEDFGQVGRELLAIEVRVGVDEVGHVTRSPGAGGTRTARPARRATIA